MEPDAVREIFRGRILQLALESWGGADHEVVHHLGAAGVLPITPDRRVILVRQFRPAIRQELVEIPAGLLDRGGEDALACARRELEEETGWRATSIEFLGGFHSSAGFTNEYLHLFAALTEPERAGRPEEGIDLVIRPLDEMVRAARGGRVHDVKTALALLLAAARMDGPTGSSTLVP